MWLTDGIHLTDAAGAPALVGTCSLANSDNPWAVAGGFMVGMQASKYLPLLTASTFDIHPLLQGAGCFHPHCITKANLIEYYCVHSHILLECFIPNSMCVYCMLHASKRSILVTMSIMQCLHFDHYFCLDLLSWRVIILHYGMQY